MMLMGQWAPGTMQANTADGNAVPFDLQWFPFPTVDGGAGVATDGFGGGNGFAVGKDAPPETVDFLKYLVSLDAANRWGALNSGILMFNVESEQELDRINEIAGRLGKRAGIAIRVNPDVDPQTHPYITTGLKDVNLRIYSQSATDLGTLQAEVWRIE